MLLGTALALEPIDGRGDGHRNLVGRSRALRKILDQVSDVADTPATVLIQGETGTGKELIARRIHEESTRVGRSFVKLNCAAIPSGLLESELFGHERGAFTGAVSSRVGRFELAHQGTLFLDEIGDIPIDLQAKLLRVLQEREFERLGSSRTVRSDVRLIAATHRNLPRMVREGSFRMDLYYRLNVFPIRVPALRERTDDIPALVWHFIRKFASQMGKNIEEVPQSTMEALIRYGWPGNIRELENFIERAAILTKGRMLQAPVHDLAVDVGSSIEEVTTLEEGQRNQILRALQESNGVVGGRGGAAARLGVPRTTLIYKMRNLGIVMRTAPLTTNCE